MPATEGTSRAAWLRSSPNRPWIEGVLATSTILVIALALFMLARRAAGVLSEPAPLSQLVATAAAVLVWANTAAELSAMRRTYLWLAPTAMLLIAVACSYPGERVADWLVWLTALVAFAALALVRGATVSASARGASRHANAQINHDPDSGSEQVLQVLTRSRTAAGDDVVRGELTAQFPPGGRQATLYVAFCPPFERQPRVDAAVVDATDASVKLAQVLHNGAQLEVRLAHASSTATNVMVELFATDAEAR